jgi:hypothetical protein
MVSFNTFKKNIELLEKNKIKYWVFGGFALDGVRGELTREHSDIDIYLFSEDLNKLLSLFNSDSYKCFKRESMHFIESDDLKIGVVLLTKENNKMIANGNKTLVKFPCGIFKNKSIAAIDNFTFQIAPNEVLAIDSKYSINNSDRTFGAGLKYDEFLFNQIKIIKIRD